MHNGFVLWLFAVSLGASALAGCSVWPADLHRAYPGGFRSRRHSRSDRGEHCLRDRQLVQQRRALSSEPPHKHPTRITLETATTLGALSGVFCSV